MDEGEVVHREQGLSKTPSWILLGFIFGALTVYMLPERPGPVPGPAAAETKATPQPLAATPRLSTVEAQFEEYGKFAIWENDLTEVALWTPETGKYDQPYEVQRVGEKLYFRSIPRLTRRVLTHGVPENLPLQFTESEASYRRFQADVAAENNARYENLLRRPAAKTEGAGQQATPAGGKTAAPGAP